MAAILSGSMMPDHREMYEEAQCIRDGIGKSLKENMVAADINPVAKNKTSNAGTYLTEFILKY